MSRIDASITVELDPIVKVYCMNTKCKYNLTNSAVQSWHCVLKYMEIGENGECKQFEPCKEKKAGVYVA